MRDFGGNENILDLTEVLLLTRAHTFVTTSANTLSPSVESCGCGLGPSPVRLG